MSFCFISFLSNSFLVLHLTLRCRVSAVGRSELCMTRQQDTNRERTVFELSAILIERLPSWLSEPTFYFFKALYRHTSKR